LDEFKAESTPALLVKDKTIAVFCLATYGEGDPSDNAVRFHAWLRDETGPGELGGMRYTVFGLGNRQYEHYNAMGTYVDNRLEELGAHRVYELGLGDDDGKLEEDFSAWEEDLVDALRAAAGMHGGGLDDAPAPPTYTYESVKLTSPPAELLRSEGRFVESERAQPKGKIDFSSKPYFKTLEFPVAAVRELRQKTTGGSTLHVEIKLPKDCAYATAHNFSVLPENDPAQVEAVASVLGVELGHWISVRSKSPDDGPLFPSPCTVRVALSCYCALNQSPNKVCLEKLAFMASDPAHRARLLRLASKAGKDDFNAYIVARRTQLWEVLVEHPSIRPSDVAHFFEACPRLMPRDYTIASSSRLHPHDMHLVVSVVDEDLGDNERRFRGVCTNYFKRIAAALARGETCSMYGFVKPSTFGMPAAMSAPMIMIGPGTGVAPMRALVQERAWLQRQGHRLGQGVLFFGCRLKDEDFIYADEWAAHEQAGVLAVVSFAFSRQNPAMKRYVTDDMRDKGALLWGLLHGSGAYVYVCGGTHMGRDVSALLEEIAVQHGKMAEAAAKRWLADMSSQGRLQMELWS